MKTADFDYILPEELIAQEPVNHRDSSRLMIINRDTGSLAHRHFTDILGCLREDDCLVVNETRVIPARILGKKAKTGGAVEILLIEQLTPSRRCPDRQEYQSVEWEALVKPGARLAEGAEVELATDETTAKIGRRLSEGRRSIWLTYKGDFDQVLKKVGQIPLPPYIHKPLDEPERYQTVYAKESGSVAAPTAGLHFTSKLLNQVKDMGVTVVPVSLTVGVGTFQPVRDEQVEDHRMHPEQYELPAGSADAINEVRARRGRIIAVGTTSVRVLESASRDETGILLPSKTSTDIFIYPGYSFKVVDAMITNFHLPCSSLLMLVCAFAGRELIMKAYTAAIQDRYRFFSFGDAMMIE